MYSLKTILHNYNISNLYRNSESRITGQSCAVGSMPISQMSLVTGGRTWFQCAI